MRIISVYSKSAYKEFRLPPEEKRDYSITLGRKDFDIAEDVKVILETMSSNVLIKESDDYRVFYVDEIDRHKLSPGHEVRIVSAAGDKFILMLEEQPEMFRALSRLDLSGRDSITIGCDPDNDICYSHLGYVSGKHAEIRRCQNGWVIFNFSKNGVYVNTHRITKSQELVYGDHINIAGLHIIVFDDMLTMYDAAQTVYVNGMPPVNRESAAGHMASASREETGSGALPEFVSLSDAIKADSLEDIGISERWAKHRTYDHIKGVIGEGIGGIARAVDLHERYNGPHMLVAGTTGAGKSELLKTLVLSLAMEYSPEDINFVLVDFKGGGMANTLADIPHTAGCVTNLSGGEIERAMLAVKCEVRERQVRLNDAGVNHIDDYIRLKEAGKADRPMPHIIIVIDEYAELKKEKPDLMADLVSIAETGRSLGIHLVIATQRPEGNVDDNIRSNVRTDICLRVQNKESSMDVLGRPDAAFISCLGRAYIKVGENEVFEQFQTAFSDTETVEGIKTQLAEASDRAGMRAEKLWLDPLEEKITLDTVSKYAEDKGSAPIVLIGMVDDPEKRNRYPLALDLAEAGNIAAVGMPASGKTTLVYTLLRSLDGTDTEINILDLDTGMLKELNEEGLNVRRYVNGSDSLEIEDFLDDIEEEIDERKTADDKQRVVVVIDSYEELRDKTGYSGEKKLADLMREAESSGMTIVITGGGFGLGQIAGGAEKNIKTVLCLSQRSIYDYMDALHTKEIYAIPDADIKGRGLTLTDGRVVEFQTAVCDERDR